MTNKIYQPENAHLKPNDMTPEQWAEELVVREFWPCPEEPCYDCGSEIPNSHTELCTFIMPGNYIIPHREGSQIWVGRTK